MGIIIPTDLHIFQRGRYTTNQMNIISCQFMSYPHDTTILLGELLLPQVKPLKPAEAKSETERSTFGATRCHRKNGGRTMALFPKPMPNLVLEISQLVEMPWIMNSIYIYVFFFCEFMMKYDETYVFNIHLAFSYRTKDDWPVDLGMLVCYFR